MIKKFISHPLYPIFREGKNSTLFGAATLLNALAALLEGGAFSFLLLSFAVLDGKTVLDLQKDPLFSFLPLSSHFLLGLTSKGLFALFISLALINQVIRGALCYLAQLLTIRSTIAIQISSYRQVFRQIFRLSFPCISQYKIGDLIEYANAPAEALMPIATSISTACASFFTSAILLMLMANISWQLTLAILFIGGLLIFLQKNTVRKILRASHQFSLAQVEFNKHAVQSLQAMRPLHTYYQCERTQQEISSQLHRVGHANGKLHQWFQLIAPVNETIGICLVGVSLILGPFLLQDPSLPLLSSLLGFMGITYRFSTRLQMGMERLGVIAQYLGPIFRLKEILRNEDKDFIAEKGAVLIEPLTTLALENVSLCYPNTPRYSVEQISFTIQKGSVTALVGPSGAGKSTLVDLIIRLYEPTSGSLLINGTPLAEYSLESWRQKLGVVSQDSFIFNETIEDNIRFGQKELPFDAVAFAAEQAGIHAFITRLPEGYKTVVGERGYKLSGGERQRIALARALLRNPELLILDEATSSLDTLSEHVIQDALKVLQKKKTFLIVAHRLSTVAHADQILVLEKGQIVERGTHEELLALQGTYAKMWHLQTTTPLLAKAD